MTIEERLDIDRFSLYHPMTAVDLLMDYPELRKVGPFMRLRDKNPRKLVFVWWYACKASPAMMIVDDAQRIKYAMLKTWGERVPADVEKELVNRQWGADVSEAIASIRAYEPHMRVRMRLLAEIKFHEAQKLMEAPASAIEAGEKMEHFKMVAEGMKLIRDLLPMMEIGAHGVVEVEKSKADQETAMAADFAARARTIKR